MNPFSVEGRLVLVTAATRGIGLGEARALEHSGAGVILVGRDGVELERSADAGDLRRISPWMMA